MKIEMMMIGALLFGLVFALGIDVYSKMLSNYDVDIDTSTTFGKMSSNAKQIQDETESMRTAIEGGEVSEGGAEDDMFSGGYKAIKNNPFTALGVAKNATETLMFEMHMIPDDAIEIIMIIFSIFTLFAIIALIFRFQQR